MPIALETSCSHTVGKGALVGPGHGCKGPDASATPSGGAPDVDDDHPEDLSVEEAAAGSDTTPRSWSWSWWWSWSTHLGRLGHAAARGRDSLVHRGHAAHMVGHFRAQLAHAAHMVGRSRGQLAMLRTWSMPRGQRGRLGGGRRRLPQAHSRGAAARGARNLSASVWLSRHDQVHLPMLHGKGLSAEARILASPSRRRRCSRGCAGDQR